MSVDTAVESFSKAFGNQRVEECRERAYAAASEEEARYQGVSVEELRETYLIKFLYFDDPIRNTQ